MRFLLFLFLVCSTSFCLEKKVIRIFTALCDNEHQSIVEVPAKIGNGEKPSENLYWGALYGIKTWFTKSEKWKQIAKYKVNDIILERIVLKRRDDDVYLVADAYCGRNMKECLSDYFNSLAGNFQKDEALQKFKISFQETKLSVFVGHNGLMDFQLPMIKGKGKIDAMSFCCKSRPFFEQRIKNTGSKPYLLTNGLMAPEAYSVSAAIDGWLLGNTPEAIARRAASAYNLYQKCGHKGAYNLFRP